METSERPRAIEALFDYGRPGRVRLAVLVDRGHRPLGEHGARLEVHSGTVTIVAPGALTPQGRAYAVAMVRRHRLLETFLVTTLGYPWEEVHDEAAHVLVDEALVAADVEVHPTTGIIADNILQIRAMIDAVKRLSAHYDVYLGYTLPAVIAAYAVPVVGVELTVST